MEKYHYDEIKQMFSLETNYQGLGVKKIQVNKKTSKVFREARSSSKESTCYLCRKPCEGFCNSHSIPQFSLINIAENGKVAETLQGELPLSKDDIGVKKAGTFNIICNNCDNTMFSDYETPSVYSELPNNRMLAQIALKNYLQMVSKRRIENKLYEICERDFDNFINFPLEGKTIEELDLQEYERKLQYAVKTLQDDIPNRYHICFHKVLDYVVPYATQTSVCLITDLEDGLINNPYLSLEQYRMEYLQVVVFPLEHTSVVLLFVEDGVNRYRKFIKQLKRLSEEDQLSVINYLVFSYTENVFLNVNTQKKMKGNPAFMEVCRKTSLVECPDPSFDPIDAAMQVFSFSHRITIPNLLDRKFALNKN